MKSETGLRLMATGLCLRNGCGLHRDGETYVLKRGVRQIRISGKHLLYSIDTARHFDTYFFAGRSRKKGWPVRSELFRTAAAHPHKWPSI